MYRKRKTGELTFRGKMGWNIITEDGMEYYH
jgi:hypothetical protein